MSKKQQIPNTSLSGRNIYTDKKKRVIYYDSLTKQGYLVDKKSEGPIMFYQNRLVIILFAAILCAGTFLTWQQATIAGVALFAVVEVYYRKKLFKNLEVVTDVDFGRRLTPLQSILARKSREKVGKLIGTQKGIVTNHYNQPMETAKSTVYAIYSGDQKYDLRNYLMLSILDQVMDIVYTETIREEEGGTYGVGTMADFSPVDNSWLFLFGFDTNPQDEKRLTDRAHAELMKVVNEGPREKDFTKVKEYMLKKHAQNQRENSYWREIIRSNELGYGDNDTNYEETLNSITIDDMKAFSKKLFTGKNLIEVIMTGVEKAE